MLRDIWPLFGLRIVTPRLELRPPTDEDLAALAAVAADGVHDPDHVPFAVDWTSADSPQLEQDYLRYHWGLRAGFRPDDWMLELAVVADGAPIGCQALQARHFSLVRAVSTGSWLGLRHQGQGFGTEMRAAVLELAFAHLGAVEARSSARSDNGRSLGVSRKLGLPAERHHQGAAGRRGRHRGAPPPRPGRLGGGAAAAGHLGHRPGALPGAPRGLKIRWRRWGSAGTRGPRSGTVAPCPTSLHLPLHPTCRRPSSRRPGAWRPAR